MLLSGPFGIWKKHFLSPDEFNRLLKETTVSTSGKGDAGFHHLVCFEPI